MTPALQHEETYERDNALLKEGETMGRLFETGKIPVFFDDYGPGVEKRSGEEISVVTVRLRVQPFDADLASALDNGVGGDSNIRPTVFNMSSAEPKKYFSRHDFHLDLERQNLEIFATPDTNLSRVAFTQAKISGCYVRTEKDVNALALCLKATFGPVGRDELEIIHSMHRRQAWITFHQSEPLLELEEVDGDPDDEEPEEIGMRQPEFDDPRDDQPEGETAREVGARRNLHTGRKGKGKGKGKDKKL